MTKPDIDAAELARRHQTVLSLIGHRTPTEYLIVLIQMALEGASLEELMELDGRS